MSLPVEVIDVMLVSTSGRQLFSQEEVQNMLLDIRLIMQPTEEKECLDVTEQAELQPSQ
jgi:hypothetical protein